MTGNSSRSEDEQTVISTHLTSRDSIKLRNAFANLPYSASLLMRGGLWVRDQLTIDDLVALLADLGEVLKKQAAEADRTRAELDELKGWLRAVGAVLATAQRYAEEGVTGIEGYKRISES